MAHQLEFVGQDASMFFVGDKPWHGQGIPLENPPTIKEAIRCAKLDWTVEAKRLVLQSDTTVEAPAFANVRSRDGRILGVVGPDYKPIQNEEAFDWFQPWVDSGLVTLETAGSLKEGQHVWILAKIKADPVEIVKGDPLVRYILLSNSHDGSRMARAGFTATRVVCWNTVNAALTSKKSRLLKVRHTKNANDALKDIQETMDLANANFQATVEQMQAMARKGITTQSLMDYVVKVFKPTTLLVDEDMTEEQEQKCERTCAKIIPLFEKGRGNDMKGVKGTVWGAYNAVTEYLTWERGRTAENRMQSLWFGDGAGAAQRAFTEAVKLAA